MEIKNFITHTSIEEMEVNYLMDMLERITIKCLKQFKMKYLKQPNLEKEDNAQTIIIKDFTIQKNGTISEMKPN